MNKKQIVYGKNVKGFTLIELLTVISIIAILTGLFTVSYLSVRQRGRDAQRKSDIKQIQSALELYRSDNDAYPDTATIQGQPCNQTFSSGTVTYMKRFPCDPNSTSTAPINYYYWKDPNSATSYVIASCLETTSDKDATQGTTAPSWWPSSGAAWPPATTCSSGYYYLSSNP